jgi:hypothetical protein
MQRETVRLDRTRGIVPMTIPFRTGNARATTLHGARIALMFTRRAALCAPSIPHETPRATTPSSHGDSCHEAM